jgi:acetyl esterase
MTTPDSPSLVLEEAAQAFADTTANPPYLFDLSVAGGRKTAEQGSTCV